MKAFDAIEIIANVKRDPINYQNIGWTFTQKLGAIAPVWRIAISNWHGPLPLTMDELLNKTEEQIKHCCVSIRMNDLVLFKDVSLEDLGGMKEVAQLFHQNSEIVFH